MGFPNRDIETFVEKSCMNNLSTVECFPSRWKLCQSQRLSPPGGFTFVRKPALSLLSTKILNESQGLSQETKLDRTRVGGEFCSGEVIIQDR